MSVSPRDCPAPAGGRRPGRVLPFLDWLPLVDATTARADLWAALTGAIVVLPQGMAFAAIAGMPPEYGLYAGMVPAIIAALFGSSWHLVSGPTTAASIVLFSSLSVMAEPGSAEYVRLALTLTCMVGVIQLFLGFARLGTLVNFVSHAVIVGFTAGAAVLIAATQIRHLLGIETPARIGVGETLVHVTTHLPSANPYTVAVALVTLATGIALRRWLPRFPFMIGALLAGGLAAVALGAAGHDIATIDAIPATLPPLSRPEFGLSTIQQLAPAALAMSLFALTEAITIGRSIALRTGQQIDGSREFIGQGLSNVVGSFFSAYVATGSFNRSALNYEAGARTPLAAILAGLLLMGVVVLVAPLAGYLPDAAMAAVLLLVARGLVDVPRIRRIIRASRSETIVMAATFVSALVLGLEFAILLGVSLSLATYLNRTSRPHLEERVPDPQRSNRGFSSAPHLPTCPQLRMVRINGSLFFGAVSHVARRLQEIEARDTQPRDLALLAGGMNFIDVAGAEFLAREAQHRRRQGRRLYLFRVKPPVHAFLRQSGYLDEIGAEHVFVSKEAGVAAAVGRLDRGVCDQCRVRIFRECP